MANGAEPTFEIGLAMAGAISAGAYSAGVLDFLIEALEEWEKVRGEPGIPNHRVVIKVISGASAGAITGALGAVALAGGVRPDEIPGIKTNMKVRAMLPNLYRTWVVGPRFVSTTGTDFLSEEDLRPVNGVKSVTSVLNSVLLDQISDAAFNLAKPPDKPYAYLAKDLHVYLTVTNLRGIPYSEGFAGGPYGMQTHGDRMHYVIQGLGGADAPSSWAKDDPGTPLDVKGLFGGTTAEWKAFGLAAVASGAFPVGLAPRLIAGTTAAYEKRYMPIDIPTHVPPAAPGQQAKEVLAQVTPCWPPGWLDGAGGKFPFLTVDGGVINNEPFEYARFALMANPPEPNPREGELADRAVIMIDPFPEPPDFLPDGMPVPDVLGVASAILPALINQARFKPTELLDAANESVFSRFLIAPHRHISGNPKDKDELYGIACGVLSGFGGFLDEAFRQHDFQLGRRNCQRFLRQSFALPASNAIMKPWLATAPNTKDFQTEPETPNGPIDYCIIPLVGLAKVPNELLPWPRMSQADFDTLQDRLKKRIKALVPILIDRQTNGVLLRIGLRAAALVAQGGLFKYVKYYILSDLIRRDLIAGWELQGLPAEVSPQNVRDVLAELAQPAFDYRTPARLAAVTHLKSAQIDSILAFLKPQDGKPYQVWQSSHPETGTPVYTLYSRKPSDFWLLPGASTVANLLPAPAID